MPVFSLIVIKTHQMQAVRLFYTRLGIEFRQEKHEKGPIHFSGKLGEVVFEIYPLGPDRDPDTTTRLGIIVEDLNRILEDLGEAGFVITEPQETEWGLQLVVRDPDDRAVELTQRAS